MQSRHLVVGRDALPRQPVAQAARAETRILRRQFAPPLPQRAINRFRQPAPVAGSIKKRSHLRDARQQGQHAGRGMASLGHGARDMSRFEPVELSRLVMGALRNTGSLITGLRGRAPRRMVSRLKRRTGRPVWSLADDAALPPLGSGVASPCSKARYCMPPVASEAGMLRPRASICARAPARALSTQARALGSLSTTDP